MSDDGSKPRHLPPGGVRLPAAVRELALIEIEKCLIAGWDRTRIFARMSELNATESQRTTDGWISEVREKMMAREVDVRPIRRMMRRAQLEARYAILLADIDEARQLPNSASKHMAIAMLSRSAAALEQLMIKIDGLEGPIKIEMAGAVDIRTMSPDQRRERIEVLLAKRAAAKEAGLLPPPEGETVH